MGGGEGADGRGGEGEWEGGGWGDEMGGGIGVPQFYSAVAPS